MASGSVHDVGPEAQQVFPWLPHSQVPFRQTPVPLWTGKVQLTPGSTHAPPEQQAEPAQVTPAQQGWPGPPQGLQKSFWQALVASSQLPRQQRWLLAPHPEHRPLLHTPSVEPAPPQVWPLATQVAPP
jgi:hypothetical protein